MTGIILNRAPADDDPTVRPGEIVRVPPPGPRAPGVTVACKPMADLNAPPCRLSPARQKSGFGAKRKWAGRQNQLTRSKMSPHRTFKAVLSFRNISRGERMPMQIRREHDARF
jgi:hypothetical protein